MQKFIGRLTINAALRLTLTRDEEWTYYLYLNGAVVETSHDEVDAVEKMMRRYIGECAKFSAPINWQQPLLAV